MSAASRPIGVFDPASAGSPWCARSMERLLEDIVSLGDTARVPTG